MEKRTLRGFLMDRCFWRGAMFVCFLLALQLGVLSWWQIHRDPGRPEVFLPDGRGGLYAELGVADVSDAFTSIGGDRFYFLVDTEDYYYVAVLSDRQFMDLCEDLDSGIPQVCLSGITVNTPVPVRRDACDYFGYITYEEYEDYFGASYLDCTRTPFSAAALRLAAAAAVAGLLSLAALFFWLRRRHRVSRDMRLLQRSGRMARALEQLENASPEQMAGPLTMTDDFLCDGRTGTLCARSELKNLELRRARLGPAHLRARRRGGMRTVARLSKRQLSCLPELLRPSRTALTVGNFAAPAYWTVPADEKKEGC